MRINVSAKANYSGKKDGVWTEGKTGEKHISEDLFLVHRSETLIKCFKSGVYTCAYNQEWSDKMMGFPSYEEALESMEVVQDYTPIARPDIPVEYIYVMKLPKGTFIEEFYHECRFLMNDGIEISLIGELGNLRVKDDSSVSRVYGSRRITVFTKRY